MKELLIVSPHFPPTNAPDAHRVRISAPFFGEFGWHPHVIGVDAAYDETPRDEALADSLPRDLAITRVRALPARWTRRAGIGNVALRALPFLYAAGARLLRAHPCDLVYFSTTLFASMALGRVWKRRFGVPYVVDMQDPWLSSYYEEHPAALPPPKYRLSHALDSVLEPWTMKQVDGVIAVSQAYIDTLRRRYPAIDSRCCATLPFGGSPRDFDLLPSLAVENPIFRPGDGAIHGVYVGRGGHDMAVALRILLRAFAAGRSRRPDLFDRVRLHFVGTDYAPADRARRTVEPIAREAGVGDYVTEQTERVGYFDSLQLLRDADFLVVVGSDDPQYSGSKIYPYVLARRPVLAVLHEQSGAVPILQRLHAGPVVTFATAEGIGEPGAILEAEWSRVLARLPCEPDTDWSQFEPFTAKEMARRQCEVFDEVLLRRRAN